MSLPDPKPSLLHFRLNPRSAPALCGLAPSTMVPPCQPLPPPGPCVCCSSLWNVPPNPSQGRILSSQVGTQVTLHHCSAAGDIRGQRGEGRPPSAPRAISSASLVTQSILLLNRFAIFLPAFHVPSWASLSSDFTKGLGSRERLDSRLVKWSNEWNSVTLPKGKAHFPDPNKMLCFSPGTGSQ